ncbi:uncharacterized protein LOC131436079 [Malaya genurostris]|uniref:uncharacterized protein LOC131436079 n=1 Tax=Malaya genurostris TaxID=325434 RepID=UPI0026F40398|nr:uncharacterized protein LOC131436079 [Malaya genurostris]
MRLLLGMLCFICFVFTYCSAYARLFRNATHPDYPNQCFDPITETHLKVGTIENNEKCERISCSQDYTMSIFGCGVVAILPGCQSIPTDYEKPYPDCCAKADCSNLLLNNHTSSS